MNAPRIYWRRAHPVRQPDRINTPPHVELFEAYRNDRLNEEIAAQLAAELEREFRAGDRAWE